MVKVYIKRNLNELADVAFPDGCFPREMIDNFMAKLCIKISCHECLCKNLCHYEINRKNMVSSKFKLYFGEFDRETIDEAIEYVNRIFDLLTGERWLSYVELVDG